MGTVVPSGSVVVVGAADKLIVCWPKAAAAAKRRNTLITAAAFSVALHLKSFIRIMFLASRLSSFGPTWDLKPEFLYAIRRLGSAT
jgi:hypothetical protein